MSDHQEKDIVVGDELAKIAPRTAEVQTDEIDVIGQPQALRLAGVMGFTREQLKDIAKKNDGQIPLI